MRFNNLHVEEGDSRKEITRKINDNFSQIVSFSAGPKGRPGEIGPTGYPGSAGPKGSTGDTGSPPSVWYYSRSQPLSANNYDYWINQSQSGKSEVYEYQSGWNQTGFSFLEDTYFSAKWELPFSGGTSDYSAIYLSGDNPSERSLVISDYGLTADSVNPNYSKFLITTTDQTEKPIISFRNTYSPGQNQPSFYWETLGNTFPVIFSSDYDFSIKAGGSASSQNGGLYLGGGETGDIRFGGYNFNFQNRYSDTLISNSAANGRLIFSAGRYFLVRSSEWNVEPSLFSLKDVSLIAYGKTEIDLGNNNRFDDAGDGTYINIIEDSPEGVVLSYGSPPSYSSNQSYHKIMRIGFNRDFTFLSAAMYNQMLVVKAAAHPSGQYGEKSGVSFGVTGGDGSIYPFYSGYPTSATGPWGYHVQKGYSATFRASTPFSYVSFTGPIPSGTYYYGVIPTTFFVANVIRVVVTAFTSGGPNLFVKIPSFQYPATTSNPPFYSSDYCYEYRILLSDTFSATPKKIRGIVYDLETPIANNINLYKVFNESCNYIDIMYFYDSDSASVKVYVKTCKGESYYLTVGYS